MATPLYRNPWSLWALIGLAGLSLWLLLAGPGRVLGVQTSYLGILLLLAGTWAMLYAVSRVPEDALDAAASPAEWNARIGTTFCVVAIVYVLANLSVFDDAPIAHNRAATQVGTNLVLLLVAWGVVSGILASRWKSAVDADERDRDIAAKAASWGHSVLVVCVIGIAVTLALTPPQRLGWATPLMIGNLLILVLMGSRLCEYLATVALYRRDRLQLAED
jgi:hypothetical protein